MAVFDPLGFDIQSKRFSQHQAPPKESRPTDRQYPCLQARAPSRESARTARADRPAAAHRRNQADRAGQRGGFVAQDIAKKIRGQDHIELRRAQHEFAWRRYRRRDVRAFTLGISRANAVTVSPPERRCGQHVGLVHAGHAAVARRGALEREARDRARSPARYTSATSRALHCALASISCSPK